MPAIRHILYTQGAEAFAREANATKKRQRKSEGEFEKFRPYPGGLKSRR